MIDFLLLLCFFFFNDTATTEIYTLSLHDALPISSYVRRFPLVEVQHTFYEPPTDEVLMRWRASVPNDFEFTMKRSEEHTSELQSRQYLVCRLLLEKKKTITHKKVVISQST